jgi:hypothetical protein
MNNGYTLVLNQQRLYWDQRRRTPTSTRLQGGSVPAEVMGGFTDHLQLRLAAKKLAARWLALSGERPRWVSV